MSTIDILQLVDRLEELAERGRRLPFGNSVSVDREAFLNLIDQMRITIPQEIKRCQAFESERDRYIAQAQEDARAIMEQAHEDAAKMLDEQAIRRQAETDARRTLERAKREAEEIRAGADAYAAATLRELDRHVQLLARTIENGLRELEGPSEEDESDELAGEGEPSDEQVAETVDALPVAEDSSEG